MYDLQLRTYLSVIQSSNSNGTYEFNLLVVKDDHSEMQHAIDSIICHTLWLQSESFACMSMNDENSYGLTETTVTNLVLKLAQETLRIASCIILQPKKNDHSKLTNTVSFLSKILPYLQECLIEEISLKSLSSFQNNMDKMITSFIMDVFYALHTCSIQSILEKYNDDNDAKQIISELYEEIIDFTISLEVALLEKNDQKPLSKQQRESFIWTLLWGLSQSKLLETVLIPAVDILPRLFYSDMPMEIVERTLFILINDYKSVLQENSQSDHADYFFESAQNVISAISTTFEKWYHIVTYFQHHLNNFVDTFARTGHNDSFWGIVTCLDFTTQIVSTRSNIQSDDFQCDGKHQRQYDICHLKVVKETLQKCQPYANVCGNITIGDAMAKLMNNLGPFIMNGDLNLQNSKVDAAESIISHKLDLLNYCHELVYMMIPSDLSNYEPNNNNLFEQFSKAAKTISQYSDTNVYIHQYEWNQNDQYHPLNALLHIVAKLTVLLRTSRGKDITPVIPSMLQLVFTATKYAAATSMKTTDEDAINLFCVDYIVPLIESSHIHCFQGLSCVTILIQIFSALKFSNDMMKNDSMVFFLRNLENPLNLALFQCVGNDSALLTARTTLALLVIQCSNSMMNNSINTQEKVNINNNVLSKCLEIVNQSMSDLIINNDGDCISRLAIELKNSIEEVCSEDGCHQLSDDHCAAFLKILNQLLELLSREILRFEEAKTLEDELWTVSFVEACLWAGRASFRTEVILYQPQTFSKIIQICLHVLGTNHWQICIEGRACKASLDCLKWAFWCCCSFGKSVERRQAINDCMTVSFGDEKIIHQILYILSCGSLGCTCSVKEMSFESQFLIRRKLQRAYTSCLYIVLFGDEKSINLELKKLFRNNDNFFKNCIDQFTAPRCDIPSNWVYDGLMNSDKGVHEMWAFILKIRKVLEGEKAPSYLEPKSRDIT